MSEEETEEVSKYPYWISEYGNSLGKKTYGRIWVRTEEDRIRVVKIIEELDEFEASYLGSRDGGEDDFVAVWPTDPKKASLTYGHKFEICRDKLRYECWLHGIEVWIVSDRRQDY